MLSNAFVDLDENALRLRVELAAARLNRPLYILPTPALLSFAIAALSYARSRRVVLLHDGVALACAVAEVHGPFGVLEVPLLGVEAGQRHRGYGALLTSILVELAVQVSPLLAHA